MLKIKAFFVLAILTQFSMLSFGDTTSICSLRVERRDPGKFLAYVVDQDQEPIYASMDLEFAKAHLDDKVVNGECGDLDFSKLPHCTLEKNGNGIFIRIEGNKNLGYGSGDIATTRRILSDYLKARMCRR